MNKIPKVSLVIPTRNRASLLKYALKSAVEQNYKNLEIIICDDFSDDNTKEVVESFDNRNIVYVKSKKRLNMPDTFEFALSKTKGEYTLFLTDTCYLLPNCISFATKEMKKFNARLAMWKNCIYTAPTWFEPQRQNTLYIPKTTYQSQLLDSREYLERFYNNIREPLIPKSINSLCHYSIIEKAIKKQGRFFSYPIPDHTSAVSMLINTTNFVLIDQPLFIAGISSVNIGASQSFDLGKSAQDFLKGFEGKKLDEIAFLGIYTTSALIIKSLENVRKFYPGECPELNIKNALGEIVDSLVKLETYGTNVKNFWQILEKYIAIQPNDIKFSMSKRKIKSKIKWSLVKKIRSLPYLSYLESLRNMLILKGNKLGFNNIEEAAEIVDAFNKQKLS